MKTLRISEDIHRKLTASLGTYQDAIEAMLSQSVILPPELLAEIENFIKTNKHLGYTTREEFIRDAARWRLRFLKEDFEYVEIPRDEYQRLDSAVKEMSTPFYSAADFIHKQVEEVLEQYDRWLEEKHQKGQQKRS